MKHSAACIELVKHFESFAEKAYVCEGGKWTIGWGTTVYPDGRKVREGDVVTRDDAEFYLSHDLEAADKVVECYYFGNKQHEHDALVSMLYNLGDSIFKFTTGLSCALLRKDWLGIPQEMLRWNKAGGQRWPGLVRRRLAEAAMWMNLDWHSLMI